MKTFSLGLSAARIARLCVLGSCLVLAGCGAVSKAAGMVGLGSPRPQSVDWKSLVVSAAPDANDNSSLAVDLVFVRDAALVESLTAMPAAKWFVVRGDTERAFPQGVGVVSLEVVPSQYIRIDEKVLSSQKALAVFVFASYPTAGAHRERLLLTVDSYLLQLGPKGFKAVEVSASAAK